jgi:hypothetical protein
MYTYYPGESEEKRITLGCLVFRPRLERDAFRIQPYSVTSMPFCLHWRVLSCLAVSTSASWLEQYTYHTFSTLLYIKQLHGAVLLKNLTVAQLINKFLRSTEPNILYIFTRARPWTLSWHSWIRIIPTLPIPLRAILILSSRLRLGLPSGFIPSCFWSKFLIYFSFFP